MDMKQKSDEIADFLKKAFCIDGTATMTDDRFLKDPSNVSSTFQLTDSKRGILYITLTTKNT